MISLSIKQAYLRAAVLFAGNTDVRYYLNGVHFRNLNGFLVIQATDGARVIRITTTTSLTEPLNAIVPVAAIKALIKGKLSEVALDFASLTVCSKFHGQTWNLIDGHFPDVCAVMPNSWDHPVITGCHNPLCIGDAWQAINLIKGKKDRFAPILMMSEPYNDNARGTKSGRALYHESIVGALVQIVVMPVTCNK